MVDECTNHIDKVFTDLGDKSNDPVWFNVLVYMYERVFESVPDKCSDIKSVLNRTRGSAYTLYTHHEGTVEDEEIAIQIGNSILKKIEEVA